MVGNESGGDGEKISNINGKKEAKYKAKTKGKATQTGWKRKEKMV